MSLLKRSLRTALRPATSRLSALIAGSVPRVDLESGYQQMQRSLVNQYMFLRAHKIAPYQNIKDAGFRAYSQFEEDGIILYVLSMIGFRTRRVVEMCCGGGDECMATNLILNHGFEGLLFDGDEQNISNAQQFFRNKKDCLLGSPTLRQSWITAENVNALLSDNGFTGEVDLFSLDIDGNEYWVWEAIDGMRPRLFIVETNNLVPKGKSLTIPYQPDFDFRKSLADDFRSASPLAMVNLCRTRGYRLIGAHRHGFNLFFLSNEEGKDLFPEVSLDAVYDNPYTRLSQVTRWPAVKDMPWVEV
jgi:hypothetical protein